LVKLKPCFKFWLETEDCYAFGQGSFKLLKGIEEKGTLKAVATDLNMSYRHAWGIIQEIEEKIGKPIIVTHRGGKIGGGGTELTQTGKDLLQAYRRIESDLDQIFTINDFDL
jgi:molybdate transport repressor ModE-like protein